MFRTFHNPYALGLRFHTIQLPLYDEGDGGGEGDAAGGAGDTGGGDDAPFTDLSADENVRIKLPGMAKAMSIKEFSASVLPRAQYEGTVKTMGELAKALNQQRQTRQQQTTQQRQPAQGNGGGGTQQQGAQRADLLAALEGNELPSGKDLATVLREIDKTRMTPVIQTLVKMAQRMQALEGSVGNTNLERQERDFGGDLTRSIATLKLPKTEGMQVVAEMARDFFQSFADEDQPKLRGETFDRLFKGRFETARKFFRNLEKSTLAQKQQENKARIFQRPGGGASANGKRRPMLSNRERADALFASETPT